MSEEKKPSKIWLNVLLVAFYLFILAILLSNSFGYLDPDFGWHLKMGEQIWQTRAVPDINHEDYTLLGMHWVDHEWLAELLISLFYQYFGYIVLSICFALLTLAALIIQLQFIRKFFLKDDRGLIFVLILQAYGLYACLPHFGVRIQEITVLCLLILNILIFLYNKNKDFRILFWLIPLFLFWASAHGGFLIGLFVLGLFVSVKAAELMLARKFSGRFLDYRRVLDWRQIGTFAGFSALAAAVTLATPYGWRLYSFLFGYSGSYYQSHLSEWQGQYYFPFIYPQLGYLEIVLIFLALSFFAAFVCKGNHRRRLDLYDSILIIIFVGLAIKARRHFPLLFIVSLPIMAEFLINFFLFDFLASPLSSAQKITTGLTGKISAIKKYSLKLNNFFIIFLSLALIFSGTILLVRTDFTDYPEKVYADKYPVQAVAFLRVHPEWNNLRIFNEYSWGGYLIWQDPERKLFSDGRLPQYPLGGRTELEEYGDFFTPEKMAAQLKKYDIGLVLIGSKEEYPKIGAWEKWFFSLDPQRISTAAKKSFSLLEYLRASSEWWSAYQDDTAEIFVINK